MKKIVYVAMDNVLLDFKSGIDQLSVDEIITYQGRYDEVPHIYSKMFPIPEAISSFEFLSKYYDTYILSTSPWNNPTAASDKVFWVKTYLGMAGYKRLILSHHKHLNKGDYLIDDQTKNGAGKFSGELILFGSEQFPDWISVINYLAPKDSEM